MLAQQLQCVCHSIFMCTRTLSEVKEAFEMHLHEQAGNLESSTYCPRPAPGRALGCNKAYYLMQKAVDE
jgi:hypothetical protein